jgi:hypothetical protein
MEGPVVHQTLALTTIWHATPNSTGGRHMAVQWWTGLDRSGVGLIWKSLVKIPEDPSMFPVRCATREQNLYKLRFNIHMVPWGYK